MVVLAVVLFFMNKCNGDHKTTETALKSEITSLKSEKNTLQMNLDVALKAADKYMGLYFLSLKEIDSLKGIIAELRAQNAQLRKANADLKSKVTELENRKVDLQVKDTVDADNNPAKLIEGKIVPGENYSGVSTLTLSLPRIQIGDSVRFGFYSSLDGGIPKLISPDFNLYKQQTVALGDYVGFEQPGYRKPASCFDLTIAERNRKVYPVFINEYHKDAQKIKKGNRQFIAAKVLDLASMLVMNKLFFSEPLLSISANGLDAHDPNNRFAPANAASDKKLTNRYIAVGGAWLLWGGSKGLETAARNNYLNAVTSVTREISFSVDF